MKYYSYNRKTPQPIPFRITMPDGITRTDPSSFTADEIAAAGYVEAPGPPAYNADTQARPVWDGAQWIERDLTAEEIAAKNAPSEAIQSAAIQILTTWKSTGIADMPRSWDDAITLAKSRRDELTEVADRESLRDAIIELLALRIKLSELGGEWTDVLTVAAQFA